MMPTNSPSPASLKNIQLNGEMKILPPSKKKNGSVVTQAAYIGSKHVTITIHFKETLQSNDHPKAKKAIWEAIERIAKYIDDFKLGEESPTTHQHTKSLTFQDNYGKITRSFTQENVKSSQELQERYNITAKGLEKIAETLSKAPTAPTRKPPPLPALPPLTPTAGGKPKPPPLPTKPPPPLPTKPSPLPPLPPRPSINTESLSTIEVTITESTSQIVPEKVADSAHKTNGFVGTALNSIKEMMWPATPLPDLTHEDDIDDIPPPPPDEIEDIPPPPDIEPPPPPPNEIEDIPPPPPSEEIEEIPSPPPFPPLEETNLAIPSLKAKGVDDTEGKAFHATFRDREGKEVVREKAVREDTVVNLKRALQEEIDSLDAAIATIKDPQSRKQLEAERKQAEGYLKHLGGATWASTNTPRFAFKGLGVEGAKSEYAPLLNNLRMHTVEDANGKLLSAVSRSGALSDFSHGEISLKELQNLKQLKQSMEEAMRKGKPLGSAHQEQLSQLRQKAVAGYCQDLQDFRDLVTLANEKPISWIDKKERSKYEDELLARYNLGTHNKIDRPKIVEVLSQIKRNIVERYGDKVCGPNKTIDMSKVDNYIYDELNNIIADRTKKLKYMALQELYMQFKTTPASESSTVYSRVSLLNMEKKAKTEFGCVIHERTQGLDLKALYDELEGAVIHFDAKEGASPYIDREGNIHMPKECGPNVTQTTLHTVCFNISVQGDTSNKGIQAEINQEAIAKLKQLNYPKNQIELLQKALGKCKRGGNKAFKAATLAVQLLQSKQAYVGVNCFGGKDRTGYLLASVTHDMLKQQCPKASKDQLRQWGWELIDQGSVASEIAKENADHTVLKLLTPGLKLYGGLRGIAKRTRDFAKSAWTAIKSGIRVSKTAGQAYRTLNFSATQIK